MSVSLFESIRTCSEYKFYGFVGNFCTWNWNWRINTNEGLLAHLAFFAAYVISVKMIQIYCSSPDYKPPSWLEGVKKVHNISLSIVSLLMGLTLIYLTAMDGRYASWYDMSCRMTPMEGLYGFAQFVFMVTKVWEWADTYFLILSKKPVIWLHWFHHMTTFTLAAVTHNFPSGGYTWINCMIHFVMYLHYASPVRWARPFMTTGQLVQFVIVMTIHSIGFFNPTTCFDMKDVMREWLYNIVDVFVIFIMFGSFFVEEYIVKGNKKTASGKTKVLDDSKKAK
jgi:hypothetical protein